MNLPVSHILSEKGHFVHTIRAHDSAEQAAKTMTELNIGALLVVDSKEVIGIISERDLMTRVLARSVLIDSVRVGDIMTKAPYSISPETTVEQAMMIMTEQRIRHLPVIANGELIGLISIGDVTRWSIRDQEAQITDLMRYITGTHG